MKKTDKYLTILFLSDICLIAAGFIVVHTTGINLSLSDLAIISIIFSIISAVTLAIFFRGQSKPTDSQVLHTIVAISLKFLVELVFVFIWFFIAKRITLSSVVLFFVLYLAFTLFSVVVILKTLKCK